MNYKKMLLQLGMLGTTITPISTIIACGTKDKDSTTTVGAAQLVVDGLQTRFEELVHVISTFVDKTTTLPSAIKLNNIGYVAPVIAGVTYEYEIESFNDVVGILNIKVTISKSGATAKKALVTLSGFQTLAQANQEVINDLQIKLTKSVESTFTDRATTLASAINLDDIGYVVAPVIAGVTYEYEIECFDDAAGTLDIIVTISILKSDAIPQEAIVTLSGFKKSSSITRNT